VKRRGFLGLLGAAIAAPFVPTPAANTCVGVDLASNVGHLTVVLRCDDRQFQACVRQVSDEFVRQIQRTSRFPRFQ
jgi:hypothetical protein